MNLVKAIFITLLILCGSYVHAQVVKSVVLDTIMIQAVKRGFDVADFVEMVKSDTSFLMGFRNIRNTPHEVDGFMIIYGKKNKIQATRFKRALQVTRNKRKWIEVKEETVRGDFYKRNELPEKYTAELFDEIFFYKDTLAVLPQSQSANEVIGNENKGNISRLKTLIFNPGAEIEGVPVVGKRMAIFDEDMIQYYDYAISAKMFRDSISCYVFSCTAKPGAGNYPVLKTLNTWFDRKTFNIVYRDYRYQYSGILFDFDVDMKVTMKYEQGLLFPAKVEYTGFWDIPMHQKEKVDFDLNFRLVSPVEPH